VTTEDGTVHVLATDGSWSARDSGVLADDLYDGQRTDLRGTSGRTDGVEVIDADLSRLVAPDGPPVRRDRDAARRRRSSPRPPAGRSWTSGRTSSAGCALKVRGGAPGTEVIIRHAEVLEHGELGVRPLRTAKATDSFVLAGGEELLEPNLTFHGFRYAEVNGVPGLRPDDIEAVVVGSDLRRTGWFESSDALLDRFHENVVWGCAGTSSTSRPTVPQRDERLGWTGDIQIFAPAAGFLFDTAGFLESGSPTSRPSSTTTAPCRS
jgi:alpha-L-rhamnosidase